MKTSSFVSGELLFRAWGQGALGLCNAWRLGFARFGVEGIGSFTIIFLDSCRRFDVSGCRFQGFSDKMGSGFGAYGFGF